MKNIKFRYRDAMSKGKWREQECKTTSVQDCIEWYGLNQPDVEYEIISVEEEEE